MGGPQAEKKYVLNQTNNSEIIFWNRNHHGFQQKNPPAASLFTNQLSVFVFGDCLFILALIIRDWPDFAIIRSLADAKIGINCGCPNPAVTAVKIKTHLSEYTSFY